MSSSQREQTSSRVGVGGEAHLVVEELGVQVRVKNLEDLW
jgi:hypothetical protein